MLGFLARLFGPVFAREMVESSRRRHTFLLRVAYGLVLLYAVYLAMEGRDVRSGISEMSKVSRALFQRVAFFQVLAIVLAVPPMLAGSIAGERRAGTLDLLRLTRLSDREIVLGKWMSRVAMVAMLVLSGAPVLALFTLFGGLGLQEILAMELVSLVMIAWTGAVSIWCSSRSRSPFAALASSYFAIFLWNLLPFVGPLHPLLMGSTRVAAPDVARPVLLASILFHFVFAAFLVEWSSKRLAVELPPAKSSRLFRRRRTAGWLRRRNERRAPSLAQATEATPDAEAAPLAAPRDSMLKGLSSLWGPLQIAVVDEEPPLRKNLWVFAVLGVAFLFNVMFILEYESTVLSAFLLPIWVVALVLLGVVGLTNPLFVRRPGFFDLLLGTLLEPKEILQGSVLVGWPLVLRILLIPWIFSTMWLVSDPPGIGAMLATGTLTAGWLLLLANVCSLADPRAVGRVLPTFTACAVLFFGPYLLPAALEETLTARELLAAALAAGALAWRRLERRPSAGGVAVLFASIYVAVTAALAILPGQLLGAKAHWVLWISPWFWLSHALPPEVGQQVVPAPFAGYWAALAATIVIYWTWTVGRFDHLVGRPTDGRSSVADA